MDIFGFYCIYVRNCFLKMLFLFNSKEGSVSSSQAAIKRKLSQNNNNDKDSPSAKRPVVFDFELVSTSLPKDRLCLTLNWLGSTSLPRDRLCLTLNWLGSTSLPRDRLCLTLNWLVLLDKQREIGHEAGDIKTKHSAIQK